MDDWPTTFSIHDYVPEDMIDLHANRQRHALDYLVAKGYITIHKTSVIRVNDDGLLYAVGDEDVPREMLRKEPCFFQAGAVAAPQYATYLSQCKSIWTGKAWWSMNIEESYSTIVSFLDSLPKTTHATWAALADKLRFTTAPNRSKSVLRESLQKACEQETLDWKAFDDLKKACEEGPMAIQWEQSRTLLFKLMGVISMFPEELDSGACLHDAEAAESISNLLALLRMIKRRRGDDSCTIYPLLREGCQELENLLKKNQGAHITRHLLECFIDRDAGNDGEDYGDDGDQEELPLRE